MSQISQVYNYFLLSEPQGAKDLTLPSVAHYVTPEIGQSHVAKLPISVAVVSDVALLAAYWINEFDPNDKQLAKIETKGPRVAHIHSEWVGSETLPQNEAFYRLVVEYQDGEGNNKQVVLSRLGIQQVEKVEQVVFVVGSPRSGTTALGKGLRKALQTPAHGESHALHGIQKIIETIQAYFVDSHVAKVPNNLVNQLPITVLIAQQLSGLRAIYRHFYGNQVHLDKTPGIPMIESLPVAFMAWPNAKVIYCQRRGMENVASRLRKFPNIAFEGHCRQWRLSVVAWRRVENQLNKRLRSKKWGLMVEQQTMLTQPQVVSDQVARLLKLKAGPKQRLLKTLSGDRPEQTGPADLKIKALADFGWTEQQQAFFIEQCGAEMAKQGYSLDARYYVAQENDDVIDELRFH